MSAVWMIAKLLHEGDKFKMAGTHYRIVHLNKTYYDGETTIFAQPLDNKGLIAGNHITIKLPDDSRMRIYQ